MSKQKLTDEALIGRLLDTKWPGEPASEHQISLFEEKLGVKLPPLMHQLLLRANGGEFVFARMERPFIPEDIASMSSDEVWEHVLREAKATLAARGVTDELRGQLLPFGDDYSGVVIGFDLRKGKKMQVIEGYFNDGDGSSLDDFDRLGDFREFVLKSIADADAAEKEESVNYHERAPAGREHAGAIEKVRSVLGDHVSSVEPFTWKNPSQNGMGLWFEVKHKDFTFLLQQSVKQVPAGEFGYFRVATRQGDDVISRDGEKLRRETFTNMYQANDRCNDGTLRGFSESPLRFAKGKLTSDSTQFLIYETALQQFTDAEKGYGLDFCVLALQSGTVSRFLFSLLGQDLKKNETAIVKFLLSFGFSWV